VFSQNEELNKLPHPYEKFALKERQSKTQRFAGYVRKFATRI
jgi:ribosomal protein S14